MDATIKESAAKPAIAPQSSGAFLVLRLALRELRGGLRGFWIFLACIALGVMAIAGISSISRSLTEGLAREGRTLLGGDISFALLQREANDAELTALRALGSVSAQASLRAMAIAPDGNAALVEVKAVDSAYPLLGTLRSEPQRSPSESLAEQDGAFGGIVDPLLLARLGLKVGDTIRVGQATIRLQAELISEPDRIALGIGFGPRLLVSQNALRATGLLQPGSLVQWRYRIAMPDKGGSDAALSSVGERFQSAFPDAGWDVRTRLNANPRFDRNIERFTQFLTLVGLTALLVGGVGVANAVTGFVDRKRIAIATFKSLGASGGRIVAIYLTQILLIAAIGVVAGLAVGAILPFFVAQILEASLPIPLEPVVAGKELVVAACYGFLIVLVFALAPLGRAHDMPVSSLFRDQIETNGSSLRKRYLISIALLAIALAVLSVVAAYDRFVAALFLVAISVIFLLLRGISVAIMAAARRAPRSRHALLRFAVANLHRPGALTPSLVLSLGLGISFLATLAVTDANLRRQLTESLPNHAPSFFFLDVPSADTEAFERFFSELTPGATLDRVPMMRGRIISIKGVPVERLSVGDDAAWAVNGDRGITFSSMLPKGSALAAGEWWPENYSGKPLVSFEEKVARGLGLDVGDEVVVNVLGRNIAATVASLRKVEWNSLTINFLMVFSPGAFSGAPYTQLATVAFPNSADTATEMRIARETAQRFPQITSVRVRDALDAINDMVGQLVLAIRGASSIALIASFLVLAGALASGQRARLHDAVVLKTLGATRVTLLSAYSLEYAILGIATALFGILAGFVAGYAIVTIVMKLDFTFEFTGVLVSAISAVVMSIILGLAGTWRILTQKPAAYLREL